MGMNKGEIDRRRLISGIGTAVVGGLAGCIGSSGGDSTNGDSTNNGSEITDSDVEAVFDNLNADSVLEVATSNPMVSGTMGIDNSISPEVINKHRFWLYFEFSDSNNQEFSRKAELETEFYDLEFDEVYAFEFEEDLVFDGFELESGDEFTTEIRTGSGDFSSAVTVKSQESVAVVPDTGISDYAEEQEAP